MMMETCPDGATLTHTTRIRVRFSDIDAMRCVWHGAYVRFMEDGREAFGRHFAGIGYADIMRSGITAPVVDMEVKYLVPLTLDDEALVTTRYVPRRGARLDYTYEIRRAADGALCATGRTTQLFIDEHGEQVIYKPAYYAEWQQRWGVITD